MQFEKSADWNSKWIDTLEFNFFCPLRFILWTLSCMILYQSQLTHVKVDQHHFRLKYLLAGTGRIIILAEEVCVSSDLNVK